MHTFREKRREGEKKGRRRIETSGETMQEGGCRSGAEWSSLHQFCYNGVGNEKAGFGDAEAGAGVGVGRICMREG